MKKAAILLFAAFILASILSVKDVYAQTYKEWYEGWFEGNKQEFEERICPTCEENENTDDSEEPEDCVEEVIEEEEEEVVEEEEEVIEEDVVEEEIEEEVVEEEVVEEEEVIIEETYEEETYVEFEAETREDSSCSGSIGNLVWLDTNENTIKDGNEKGLDDVKITLKWIGRDFKWNTDDDEEMTTHTNSKGKYEFDDLCEGDYKVYVKGNDVAGYTQSYDPDGDPNLKAKVYLDGDKDDHTKADFGFTNRSTPATGSGTFALFVAGAISLLSLLTFKQLKKTLY